MMGPESQSGLRGVLLVALETYSSVPPSRAEARYLNSSTDIAGAASRKVKRQAPRNRIGRSYRTDLWIGNRPTGAKLV
jgi:hypothetical protein